MLSDLELDSGFWYLASPFSEYRDGCERAALEVAKMAGALTEAGIPVYCPVAESFFIARCAGLDPLDHEMWMEHDRPIMEAAHGLLVYMMEGWDHSRGVAEEIRHFRDVGKPVLYLSPRPSTDEDEEDRSLKL